MSTYSLRKLSSRVQNAHIRVTDIGWQFADDLTPDESRSLAYIATLLGALHARITRRTDDARDPRGSRRSAQTQRGDK